MVPFGLAQAPAYFQLLMNKVLKGLKFAMMYLDDIIIFSQDESQHLEHLEIVFSHLQEAGLKMKRSKCDFFKSEIHYLGHLISPEGISPLPNKLDSIKHMPAPNSAKEIKQFLGLTGYYRKFVPRFADISRPLTTLTKKDAKFKWTSACQKSFELLKEALCGEPVLKYADTSKPYTLYTDASKYGWAGVLTQPHIMTIDGKSTTTDHPVAFASGLFRGSQLNWAALMKEAFAIYMSIKKLLFYLTDAQILLRSDHKPLEKFLLKNTLNSKVNNWAMELEAFNIQFDYIKGSNNILADTLSRLISIDPDTPTTPEEPGYEFGYAIFEEFLKVTTKTYEVNEVIVGTNTEIFKNDPELQNSLQCIENPTAPQKLQKLQQQDTNIEILKRKLRNNRLDKEYYSLDENELLTRKVINSGHEFHAIYLPSGLIFQVLRTAHDDLGHNGFPRTHAAIKRVFFWKGMKEDIRKHCKTCATCQLHKLENVKFERKIFKPSLQPMDFICMDLIGEFHPPTSRGHRYALTAVCMLTGFTWCVPLKTKTAEEVAKAYMDHIYCNFGGSIKILTDNGQFYAVYGNSYQRNSTKPMLKQTWATGELIDQLAVMRQAFGYTGLAGSTPPLVTGTQPTASTSCQPDGLLPKQPAPKTVQYQPPSFKVTRPTAHLTMNERIQVYHNYISAVSSLEHKKDLINRLKQSDTHNISAYEAEMSHHMTLHEDVLERILNILKQDNCYRTLEDLPVIDDLTAYDDIRLFPELYDTSTIIERITGEADLIERQLR